MVSLWGTSKIWWLDSALAQSGSVLLEKSQAGKCGGGGWCRVRGAWGTGGRWWAEVMETRVMGRHGRPGAHEAQHQGSGPRARELGCAGLFLCF